MGKLVVYSECDSDARVLADLWRVYFPGARVEQAPGVQRLDTQTEAEQEGQASLYIQRNKAWNQTTAGFTVILKYQGGSYTETEGLCPGLRYEKAVNRERRMLRLAVHKVLTGRLRLFPSPWGILTGVRPTKVAHRLFEQGLSEQEISRYLMQDYGLAEKKADFVTKIAVRERPYLMDREDLHKVVSLYIHIPFCPTRCRYCSFPSFSLKQWGHLLEDYLSALGQEMQKVGAYMKEKGLHVQTIYIGGGTPTVLSAPQLDRLLETIETSFTGFGSWELTVEGGRPDTLEREKLQILKRHGVTRLSVNPQTMNDKTLQRVDRKHTAEDILTVYKAARAMGFAVINMDLIIGLPGENREILSATLEKIIHLRPENITLHALALKRASSYRQEPVALPGPQKGRELMELAQTTLERAGYLPYYLYRQKEILAHGENVGYTLFWHPCIYNIQMIEERQVILGFGVGAGSKFPDPVNETVENIYNPRDLPLYLARLAKIIRQKVDKLERFI